MKQRKIRIEPSILSADFGCLAAEAKRLEQAGADGIHIDIMDGHFVPNLTLGPSAVKAIRKATNLFLDVHLMIYNPFGYVENFIEAGADRITFHSEATEDIEDTLRFIRRCNRQAGLAFCPETPFSMIYKYLNFCDLVLIMTVNPGFGGQKFIPEALEKVKLVHEYCNKFEIHSCDIQVDGGINLETARESVKAGANVLVSGNFIFNHPNLNQAIELLKHV